MHPRTFANLALSPLAFGAFKIGRNINTRYGYAYELPDEDAAARLFQRVLDLGINIIDTAPAYGLSEERIGKALAHRRQDYFISTKVGEQFRDGQSTFDFSAAAVTQSIHDSLRRLRTDHLDFVFIHSNGDDQRIMNETDCAATLQSLRDQGLIRHIGLSGKTVSGAMQALLWASVLMVTYNPGDTSHESLIAEAARKNIGIFVKKGLASGHMAPDEAIPWILKNRDVTTLVIGTLKEEHIAANVRIASAC